MGLVRRILRKRITKILVALFAIKFAIILIVIATLPVVLSTSEGKNFTINLVNRFIPGSIQVATIDLKWFKGQHIENLTLLSPSGEPIFGLEHFSTEASLFQLLSKKPELAKTKIINPHLSLVVNEDGSSNLDHALSKVHNYTTTEEELVAKLKNGDGGDKSSFKIDFPFSADLSVEGGRFTLEGPGLTSFEISNLNLHVDLSKDTSKPIILAFNCNTNQGDIKGKVDLISQITGINLQKEFEIAKDQAGSWHIPTQVTVSATAQVISLPIKGIDQAFSLYNPAIKGCLLAALGPYLNLDLDAKATSNEANFKLKINSPQLNLSINEKLSADLLTLIEPANFSWKLDPMLWPLLTQTLALSELQSQGTTIISGQFNTFSIPMQGFEINPTGLKLDTVFDMSIADLKPKGSNEIISFSACKARCQIPSLSDKIQATLSITGQYNKQPLSLQSHILLPQGLIQNGKLETNNLSMQTSVALTGLPTSLIELLGKQPGLKDLLGPSLSVQTQLEMYGFENATLQLAVQSDRLSVDQFIVELAQGHLRLKQPATIKYEPSLSLARHYLKDANGLQLTNIAPLQINFKQFDLPINSLGKGELDLDKGSLQAELALMGNMGLQLPQVGQALLKQLFVTIDAQPLNQPIILAKTLVNGINPSDLFTQGIGPSLQGELEIRPTMKNKGEFHTAAFNFKLNSELIDFSADALLLEDKRIDFRNPIKFRYTMKPECFSKLSLAIQQRISLIQPTVVNLIVSPFSLPINEGNLENIALEVNLGTDRFEIKGNPLWDGTNLRHLQVKAKVNGQSNEISLQHNFALNFPVTKDETTWIGDVTVKHWLEQGKFNLEKAQCKLKTDLDHIPFGFADRLLNLPNVLSSTLGLQGKISLDVALDSIARDIQGDIKLAIQSEYLKLANTSRIANGMFLLSEGNPTVLDWRLTPQAYYNMQLAKFKWDQKNTEAGTSEYEPYFKLLDSVPFKLHLSHLRFPVKNIANFNPADFGLRMNLGIAAIPLQNLNTQQKASFKNISFSFSNKSLQDPVSFDFQGFLNSPHYDQSQVAIKGEFRNVFNKKGKFDFDNTIAHFNTEFLKLPIPWLKEFLPLDNKHKNLLGAMLGSELDMKLYTEIYKKTGPVTAQINSSNLNVAFQGGFKQGNLYLDKDATAHLTVTEELCKSLEQFVDKELIALKEVKQPIKFAIEADGFEVPCSPFDKSKLKVNEARLELGKAIIKNGGLVEMILNLLKLKTNSGESMTLWAAPVVFHIQDGVLSYNRADALLGDRIHIATWGNSNLINRDIDIRLGITAQTLKYASKLLLPDDYILQIPIRGKLDRISVDKKRVAIRLGALQAQKLGVGGAALGLITDALTKVTEKDPMPPAPVKPFPWEVEKREDLSTIEQEPEQSSTPLDSSNENNPEKKSKGEKVDLKDLLKLFK
ncbi:MAG: conserved putative rane protein [Chlamydiales bacterium]|jgi:hypothetical protein|nr:conserved putative rane protein [Chlamydiales bacterium]